jgi:hypothetical protein
VPDDARIAEYLAKAEDCRLEASRTSREAEKAAWLRMAEEWLMLSRNVARAEEREHHRNTRVDGNTHPIHSNIVTG